MKFLDSLTATLRRGPRTVVMFGPASNTLPAGARTLVRNREFRNAYLEASEFVEARRGWSMRNELYNDQPPPGVTASERNFIEETVFQMCLFRTLQSMQVRFDAVAGMSLGDAAAGYASGALSFEETLHVMCETVRAVLCAGGGDLVLIQAPVPRAVEVMKDPRITIVFEWTNLTVWAVPNDAARNAQRRLRASGIPYVRLGFDCLSHTSRVDVAGLLSACESLPERIPTHRFYSTLEGDAVKGPVPRARWANVISQPASLVRMWRQMREDGYTDVIYVGSVPADRDLFATLPDNEKPTSFTNAASLITSDDAELGPRIASGPSLVASDIATVFRSSSFARDPYPHYASWLSQSPVHKLDGENFFIVMGYDEALSVIRQPSVFSSAPFESLCPVLPGADAPLHTRVRRVLAPYYTRESVYAQRAAIADITSTAIKNLSGRASFDAVAELAVSVPFMVSCSFLGVRPSAAAVLGPMLPHEATWADVERAVLETGIVPDIIRRSALQQSDITQLLPFLVGAGVMTVRDLLAFAIHTLIRKRDLLDELTANPSAIPEFVDELLRYEPAIHGVARRALANTSVGNVDVPADSTVWVWLGAANRDPAHFDRPNDFVMGRQGERHIAFGAGPHFCIGSHLARLEAEVVLEGFLPYLPRLRATTAPDFAFNDLRGGFPVYPLMRTIRSWQLAFTS